MTEMKQGMLVGRWGKGAGKGDFSLTSHRESAIITYHYKRVKTHFERGLQSDEQI